MAKKLHVRLHRKCNCGSKKKYRNCCGKQQTISFNRLPKDTQNRFKKLSIEREIAEKYHNQHFGYSPPIVSCILNGKRHVGVGARLVSCADPENDWEHPLDFLLSHLITTLGDNWFKEELQKSQDEQHEIIKWFVGAKPDIDENIDKKWDKLNGKALALLHLAYDLFVLNNMNILSERLVARLKNIQNFNGARYELFMFATLIRAGFKIEYQDEVSGKQGKVPECRAMHIDLGEYVSFEAKTRNVRGILGSKEGKKTKIRLYDKIKDAIEKNISEPYIVFLDANLPELDVLNDEDKLQKIRDEIHKAGNNYKNLLPNLICVTNIPFHYGRDEQLPEKSAYGYIMANHPRIKLQNKKIIDLIIDSLRKYRYLPNEFYESSNYNK